MNNTSTPRNATSMFTVYIKSSCFFVGNIANILLAWMIRNHLKRCPYRYSSHCSTILPAIIFSDLFLCIFGFLDSIACVLDMGPYVLRFRCSIGIFIQFYTGFLVAWYMTILSSGIKNFSTPVLVYQCKLVGLIFGIAISGFLAYFHCIWMMGVANNQCAAFVEFAKLLQMWRKIDFFFSDFLPHNLTLAFGLKFAFRTFHDWLCKRYDDPVNHSSFNVNDVKISTFVHKFRNEYFEHRSSFYEATKNCWFSTTHIKWTLPILCSLLQIPMSLFIFSHNVFNLNNVDSDVEINNYLSVLVSIGHSMKIMIFFFASCPFRKDLHYFLKDIFSKNSVNYFISREQNVMIYTSSMVPIKNSLDIGRRQTESSML